MFAIKRIFIIASFGICSFCMATTTQDDMKKVSEAFGHLIGRNLEVPGVSFDVDAVITGIKNATEGKPAPMTDVRERHGVLMRVRIRSASFTPRRLMKKEKGLALNGKLF